MIMQLLFTFNSCSEDSLTEEIIIEEGLMLKDSPVVDKLIEMGYKRERIVELDAFYIVQGDLMFSKNIKDYGRKNIQSRHASTNNLVSQTNVTTMTVYVDSSIPTSGDDNWRNAIISALNDWNSNSESKAYFILSYSTNSNIIIKSDSDNPLPNNTIASAGFPVGGQPYNTILINLDFNSNSNITEGSKRYNMVHELGHCIGFRHTNWDINNEGTAGVGANLIPGTPEQDPNSVMNGGTALFSWNGFSVFDIISLEYLYPSPPPPPHEYETISYYGERFGRNSAKSACDSQNKTMLYYFQRNSVYGLTVGDTIYTNTYLTTFNGNNKWFKIGPNSFKINSNGLIVAKDTCGRVEVPM